jgi:hypothetical protein
MGSHSISNPGPEPTKYDRGRHETMRLKQNGSYGIPKIFVNGFKPAKPTCVVCDKLRVWCDCDAKSQ